MHKPYLEVVEQLGKATRTRPQFFITWLIGHDKYEMDAIID